MGRSNSINSFVLYMLLICSSLFFPGGPFDFRVLGDFFYSLVIYVAAYSGYLFFLHFWGILFIR